jgi:glutamyl-tRNA synthetase
MPNPRVRFAPSPTGYLHIGGARTALFNWLWARQNGGSFVLRIEDTDRERSTAESIAVILESMRWLGLDWDEGPGKEGPHGPYLQTERLSLYRDHAERLIAMGHAYRCTCSREDLARAREIHAKAGGKDQFRYPGTCRDRECAPGVPHVVRFRAPGTGVTAWDDVVRGRIEVPNSAQQDFVLVRSDGVPLYNFGAVVDDLTMKINLVSRGDDHIVNTAPQLLLYRAFGAEPPRFAHLPMILAPNGEKLSKRHAAVSVLDYKEQGYLPDAVLNYLARLGWSHGDQEIFGRQELIQKFSWESVGRTPGKYDAKKFLYVQAEHLRKLDDESLARTVAPFLARRGLEVSPADPRLHLAIPHVKVRAATWIEMATGLDYFFRDEIEMDRKAKDKFLNAASGPALRALRTVIESVTPFAPAELEQAVKSWLDGEKLSMKDVAQPARVALTGRAQSPGLFEVMGVLGRERTLTRLDRGIELAGPA